MENGENGEWACKGHYVGMNLPRFNGKVVYGALTGEGFFAGLVRVNPSELIEVIPGVIVNPLAQHRPCGQWVLFGKKLWLGTLCKWQGHHTLKRDTS
jgi:hypothetical protein